MNKYEEEDVIYNKEIASRLSLMWNDLREWLKTDWKNNGAFEPVLNYMTELEEKYKFKFEVRGSGKTD